MLAGGGDRLEEFRLARGAFARPGALSRAPSCTTRCPTSIAPPTSSFCPPCTMRRATWTACRTSSWKRWRAGCRGRFARLRAADGDRRGGRTAGWWRRAASPTSPGSCARRSPTGPAASASASRRAGARATSSPGTALRRATGPLTSASRRRTDRSRRAGRRSSSGIPLNASAARPRPACRRAAPRAGSEYSGSCRSATAARPAGSAGGRRRAERDRRASRPESSARPPGDDRFDQQAADAERRIVDRDELRPELRPLRGRGDAGRVPRRGRRLWHAGAGPALRARLALGRPAWRCASSRVSAAADFGRRRDRGRSPGGSAASASG